MTSVNPTPIWEDLQSQTPPGVIAALVEKHFWSTASGPTDRFKSLSEKLARYFGLYPDSETLRAEFKNEFAGLNQSEQDALFRLVKSLSLGRRSLHFHDREPNQG